MQMDYKVEHDYLLVGGTVETREIKFAADKTLKRGDIIDFDGNKLSAATTKIAGIVAEDIKGKKIGVVYATGRFNAEKVGYDTAMKVEDVIKKCEENKIYLEKVGGKL